MKNVKKTKVTQSNNIVTPSFFQNKKKGSAQNPYSIEEFEEMLETRTWSGGYVESIGNTETINYSPNNNEENSDYYYDNWGLRYTSEGYVVVNNGHCTLGAIGNALFYSGIDIDLQDVADSLNYYWSDEYNIYSFDGLTAEQFCSAFLSPYFNTTLITSRQSLKNALKDGKIAYCRIITGKSTLEDGTELTTTHDIIIVKKTISGYKYMDPVRGTYDYLQSTDLPLSPSGDSFICVLSPKEYLS